MIYGTKVEINTDTDRHAEQHPSGLVDSGIDSGIDYNLCSENNALENPMEPTVGPAREFALNFDPRSLTPKDLGIKGKKGKPIRLVHVGPDGETIAEVRYPTESLGHAPGPPLHYPGRPSDYNPNRQRQGMINEMNGPTDPVLRPLLPKGSPDETKKVKVMRKFRRRKE